MERDKGLSLIEVIIILAVMVVLIALLVPSTVQILSGARRNVTLDEMENLEKAMIGDPSLKTSGVRSGFGYLGDMGNLPATLDDLVTQGAQPAYAFNSSKGVGAGWRGPYVTLGPGSDAASHRVDAFGNDYTYSNTDYVNGQGQTVDAKVVSLGADGVAGGTGNDEDVTLETLRAETTATVTGYGFGLDGTPLGVATVTMNFPANGTLTSATTATDSAGFYQFTNIPFGIRSVSFNPGLLLVPGSVRTGSSTNNVEFRVANFTTSAITVSDFTATFTPVGGAGFLRSNILWNSATVWSCAGGNPMGSGETVNVNPDQSVAADANPTPPQRVGIDASNVQVPDIKILGSGTEARIELIGFRTTDGSCAAGTARNMSGATFSDVTLRDASSNIVAQFSFTVP
ncbi:MAG: type II secretion system protein GspG [Actinobacteria bacterium]|nr:type II secretion system protein GspG [Actinomycetota bacterium]